MADEVEEEDKKSGNLILIIILIVAGFLLMGGGVGLGYVLFAMNPPDPSQEVEEIIEAKETEKDEDEMAEGEGEEEMSERVARETPANAGFVTTYYEFPGNLTTNIRNSRKFLQIGIGLSTQYDEKVLMHVETHHLAIRSEILALASEFTEAQISGREGRQALSEALRDAINAKLESLEGFGGIEEVHFTSFVLQ